MMGGKKDERGFMGRRKRREKEREKDEENVMGGRGREKETRRRRNGCEYLRSLCCGGDSGVKCLAASQLHHYRRQGCSSTFYTDC